MAKPRSRPASGTGISHSVFLKASISAASRSGRQPVELRPPDPQALDRAVTRLTGMRLFSTPSRANHAARSRDEPPRRASQTSSTCGGRSRHRHLLQALPILKQRAEAKGWLELSRVTRRLERVSGPSPPALHPAGRYYAALADLPPRAGLRTRPATIAAGMTMTNPTTIAGSNPMTS